MLPLLRAAGDAALVRARRTAAQLALRAVLIVSGLVMLVLGLAFGGVALFFWLATMMTPAQAGLCVAAAGFLPALVLILLGLRSSRPSTGRVETQQGAAAAAAAGPGDPAALLAADAEALGRRLGAELNGYPLVITALVAGIVLGRMRR